MKLGNAVNIKGEQFEGFCPICFGANVYIKTEDSELSQKIFQGKKYICMDCRNPFDELKTGY